MNEVIEELSWMPCDNKEALIMAIEALKKIDEIIKILDDTDFNNAVSYNSDGEDFGYRESICEISVVTDGKERWLE